MSALPLVMMVAGTGLAAYGQLRQAQTASATAKYNARVAEMNADAMRKAGAFEEARLKRGKKRTEGAQAAAFAASGVRLEGTPIEVMADTATEYEMDIAASRYNTAIGVQRNISESKYQKQLSKRYRTGGYLDMGGTLLTMGSKFK